MGELKNKRIVQSRVFMDGHDMSLPNYDYEFTYPVTVYDAVKKTMDDNSATLTDELEAIYNLLRSKQPLIEAGKPGRIMTWSGVQGDIGSLDVARSIDKNPVNRSHNKIPTERAVGEQLDLKASVSDLHNHIQSRSIHITDVERAKWNSQISAATFNSHVSNTRMHISDAERRAWNAKADVDVVEDHVNNFNNPHNVTAHQAGTYTREEIDAHFKSLRETFFNYVNIAYDDRTGVATVHSYDPNNWNPNYVLSFSQALPDVLDTTATYFAIRPATDYKVNETADVVIYRKAPGLNWLEVGSATMKAGDMFIAFPSTAMYVWMQGRFIQVFADSAADEDNLHGNIWYPKLDDKCELSWVLSKETTPPTPKIIKGADGYTPIKGVDYVDGKDGEGVPAGGVTGEFLTKQSDTNYDTAWKSPEDIFTDFVAAGKLLPKGLVRYSDIEGAPKAYTGLGENDDGYITQAGVTKEFQRYDNTIIELQSKVDGPTGSIQTRTDLFNHINDYNNPHRITAEQIGSVSTVTYNNHITDFNNPHNVTAAQIGLDRVNNTADADKPISAQTQLALDRITSQINQINDGLDGSKYISSAEWDPVKSAIIFTRRDGNKVELVLPITDTFGKITFDSATSELVIPLPDGTKNRINISSMIRVYNGSTSENIQVTVGDDKVIRATVIPGTIGEFEIAPNVNLRESPTTTTQAVSDRTTKIATTEYVKNQVINNLISYDSDRPLSANMGRVLNQTKADTKDVTALINDLELTRVIDSLESLDPTAALSANMGRYLDLIKAPRVHTSPSGSTYGQATADLFGHVRASEIDPLMDGIVWRGTDDGRYARADHRHPTDATRAPLDSPHLTGEPTTPTPPDDSNDSRIANTAWIRKNIIGTSWGVCDTESNVGDKIVRLSNPEGTTLNFILKTSVMIVVRFRNTNIAENARLNVNNTGFRPIIYKDRPVEKLMMDANTDHVFVYDGNAWRLINPAATGTEIFGGSTIGGSKTTTNQMTGYLGFTTEGFNGQGITADGEVNRALIAIPFKSRKDSNVKVTISDGPNDWALRFGDNSLIPVTNPIIISNDNSVAVVQFTLSEPYPSNSPCALVIRRPEAYIKIESTTEKAAFVPVNSIGGVPASVTHGSRLILSQFYVLPINATNQTISWSVVSPGTTSAVIRDDILDIDKCGTVRIEATITNGATPTTNFKKSIDIKSVASVIEITKQPDSFKTVSYGNITESVTIDARSQNDELTYQWYQSSSNSTATGTPISGQNAPTFRIPQNLAIGSYYFFCKIRVKNDPNNMTTDTSIMEVRVNKSVQSIHIMNKPEFLLEFSSMRLETEVQPADATYGKIKWTSSNRDVAVVDNGVLYTYKEGNSTIRAEVDGKYDELNLEVRKMLSVSRISNIPEEMESGSTITLSPQINPPNATYRRVVWSVVSTNGNVVNINGDAITASGSGKFVIRGTIRGENGYIYMQDFDIKLTASFVNVTDIILPITFTWQTIPLYLYRTIVPSNASRQEVVWSIVNDNGTNATLSGNSITATDIGTVKIRATIRNGKRTSDFIKDFEIEIKEKSPTISQISMSPSSCSFGTDTDLNFIVVPSYAKDKYTITTKIIRGSSVQHFELINNKLTFKESDSYINYNPTIEITATDKNNANNKFVTKADFFISSSKVSVKDIFFTDIDEAFGVSGYRNIIANEFYAVDPINASNKTVVFSIDPLDDGSTGASISGNKITATSVGKLKMIATIEHGEYGTRDFIKKFEIPIHEQVSGAFNSVENIPQKAYTGFPLLNNIFVKPRTVDVYQKFKLNYENGMSVGLNEGSNPNDGVICTKPGVLKFNIHWKYADIDDKSFNVMIEQFKPVTDITISTATSPTTTSRVEHDLAPVVSPSDASFAANIEWSIVEANGHNVTIEGNKLVTTEEIEDTIKIRATIENGVAYDNDFTKEFNITFTK